MSIDGEFEDEAAVVVGIDLGGTKILAGAAGPNAEMLGRIEVATKTGSLDELVTQLSSITCDLSSGRRTRQVVLGVPASVDPETGRISLSPNLPLEGEQSLADKLSTHLRGCPVVLENDVNLAAYGEAFIGQIPPCPSLAFVSFGTGVGMGLVLDGKIWRGCRGQAGEVSYLPIGADPYRTAVGSQAGIFEDIVGSAAIRRRSGGSDRSVKDIFLAADDGDEEATVLIEEIARDAAVGLVAIQSILDPQKLIVGGGIGTQPRFSDAVSRQVQRLHPLGIDIETARLGSQAGMLGALHLAKKLTSDAES